ncbi:HXXEE domain-containing protein [Kribbella sp. DT2]|uniref:HXXEE domain-containing protein n=1 Tax=Kribbella sp. DT2 TaxID=3393427 RepID=UPI003CED6D5A
MASAFQWQFFVNALFHLGSWFVLRDYSPGAVTAAVIAIPATGLYFTWLRREHRATGREVLAAMTIGTMIAGLAIGFLLL